MKWASLGSIQIMQKCILKNVSKNIQRSNWEEALTLIPWTFKIKSDTTLLRGQSVEPEQILPVGNDFHLQTHTHMQMHTPHKTMHSSGLSGEAKSLLEFRHIFSEYISCATQIQAYGFIIGERTILTDTKLLSWKYMHEQLQLWMALTGTCPHY